MALYERTDRQLPNMMMDHPPAEGIYFFGTKRWSKVRNRLTKKTAKKAYDHTLRIPSKKWRFSTFSDGNPLSLFLASIPLLKGRIWVGACLAAAATAPLFGKDACFSHPAALRTRYAFPSFLSLPCYASNFLAWSKRFANFWLPCIQMAIPWDYPQEDLVEDLRLYAIWGIPHRPAASAHAGAKCFRPHCLHSTLYYCYYTPPFPANEEHSSIPPRCHQQSLLPKKGDCRSYPFP